MACTNNNPCHQPTCNSCITSNLCYENCACINPTDWECVNNPGNQTALGVSDLDNGLVVLKKVNDTVAELKAKVGVVRVDDSDTFPDSLIDKLEAGSNIALSITGSGNARKLVITSNTGGTVPDIKAKISSNDTTSDYLGLKFVNGTYVKKTVQNPGGNEQIKFDIIPSELLSTDSGNQLSVGGDGKLKTSYTAPDGSETKLVGGSGVTITGAGTISSPYVASINPSIVAARSCFDGLWRPMTQIASSNGNVVLNSNNVMYRYRFDGTLEFKGQITYTVAFGDYTTGNRKYVVNALAINTSCIIASELNGSADLKNINYIDPPQASVDQITQTYGYTIRKNNATLAIEFQSSFSNNTSKTIVVDLQGVQIHPNF